MAGRVGGRGDCGPQATRLWGCGRKQANLSEGADGCSGGRTDGPFVERESYGKFTRRGRPSRGDNQLTLGMRF